MSIAELQGSNRTNGTAETNAKTFDSGSNSNSMKNGGNHNLPPRESRHQPISKPRPQTSGATTVNFYRHIKSSDNNDTNSIKSGVVSVSVERNIHKQNMGHQYANHQQSKS